MRRGSIARCPIRTGSRSRAPTLLSTALDGRARRRRRRRRDHRLLVRARPSARGPARAPARGAEIAGGASGRNGGFALRGGAMPYRRAREWLGPETAARYWRLTETYVDRMRGAGRGRASPHRQPAPGRRRRARGAPRRVRGAQRGRLRGGVARRAAGTARRPVRGRALPSGRRRRSSLRGSCAVSLRPRRSRGSRSASTIAWRTSTARGADRRRGHGRLSERAARRARGADHPDTRPDARHRAARRSVCSRCRTTGGTASTTGTRRRRPPDRRRLSRRGTRLRVHGRRGDHRADPGRAWRGSSAVPARAQAGDHAPLGRDLRPRPRPDAGRRPRPGPRRALGRRRLLGPRQRARVRCAASSSRTRSPATSIRCSSTGSGAPARLARP